MEILLISNRPKKWTTIIEKHTQGDRLHVFDKNFDGDFYEYDVSIIDVDNPVLVEDSLKDGVPVLLTNHTIYSLEKLRLFYDLASHTHTTLINAPNFIFSETYTNMIKALAELESIYHIDIRNNNPYVDKDTSVLWTSGKEALSVLISLVERLPDYQVINGLGFDDPRNKDWLTLNMYFEDDEDDFVGSANVFISRLGTEQDNEINIFGKKGRVVCRPLHKEVVWKDLDGKPHTKISTATITWDECMFKFFLENHKDPDINGQLGMYVSELATKIQELFYEQENMILED